jgi:hypothetical protein
LPDHPGLAPAIMERTVPATLDSPALECVPNDAPDERTITVTIPLDAAPVVAATLTQTAREWWSAGTASCVTDARRLERVAHRIRTEIAKEG